MEALMVGFILFYLFAFIFGALLLKYPSVVRPRCIANLVLVV